MKQAPPRYILALSLIIPLALLAASCGGNSDSTTSEDSAPEDRRDTQDDRRDSQPDFQNSQGFWQENDSPQSFSQNRAIAIAASYGYGGAHTCALRQAGTITCWGNNNHGQLGNGQSGYYEASSVPVEVLGITDATAIATGDEFTCALRQAGTIKCWGKNNHGQLGNGTMSSAALPPPPTTTEAPATTEASTTLENQPDIQFGRDQFGRDAGSSVPVEVLGITDATAIATGGEHTCALRQAGTIACWGGNNQGQLGNGQSIGDWRDTSADSSVPVEVLGITDATAIATGGWHTCALRQTGTINCWGTNSGQLGNGTETDSSVPVEVLGITDATQITAGRSHSCALRQTGTIKCWGDNRYGQLGNGQSGYGAESSVPVEVLGITDATQITANRSDADDGFTCALLQTGTIKCWGNNTSGQLGNGTETNSSVPVEVLGITDATAIVASGEYTCALLQTGTIECWGDNRSGQLGNGAFLLQDVIGFGG